jgi:hypothetical protein
MRNIDDKEAVGWDNSYNPFRIACPLQSPLLQIRRAL